MSNLYVTITVRVSDEEYNYQGSAGEAVAKIQSARLFVPSVISAGLAAGLVNAALHDFDDAHAGKRKEEKNDDDVLLEEEPGQDEVPF